MSDLQDLREYNAYHLADRADCLSPDNSESPGAEFLVRIRDAVLEEMDNHSDPVEAVGHLEGDGAHEIADPAVPIYTHQLWQTFADLGGYNEDLDELGGTSGDMTKDAQTALYIIADRLVRVLAQELREWAEEMAEQEEEAKQALYDAGHTGVPMPD